MKIAIPVDENHTDVCISFGRAPYFVIHDTETKESALLDNRAAASQGGAGIKAAQIIVDSGATILLTPRCGENAAQVMQAAQIGLYRTGPGTVQENIAAFLNGSLSSLDNIHAGFHHHGGQ